MQHSKAMNDGRLIDDFEHAAATGYMSSEAFDKACYSLVERFQNNGIAGMSLRVQNGV